MTATAIRARSRRRQKILRAAFEVRQRPGDFAFEGDEKGWIVGGETWLENPLIAIPQWAFAVVDLWIDCKRLSSPYSGVRLPFSGGLAEQPAALMDAFRSFDIWSAASNDE
jgi:hypothetical protein